MNKVRLGTYCKIQGGYAFKSKEFLNSGIPVIRIGDIQNGFVKIENNICYSEEFLKKADNKQFIISKNDVLIAMSGATVGKLGIYKEDSISLLNQRVGKFICKNELYNKYIYYVFSHNLYQKQIINIATGCAQPNISGNQLESIIIPFCELNKQKQIVEKLDNISEAIENRKKFIEDINKLIQSKINTIIRDCNKYDKLQSTCTLKARIGWQGLTKKEYLKSGEYKLITGIDFLDGEIDFNNCFYVSKERFDQDINIQIRNKDILVTKDGTIGKVAYIDNIDCPATLNSGVFVIRIKDKRIKEKYLFYLLKTDYFQKFVENIKTGATIPHLNQGAFNDFIIPILDEKTQDEFIKFVDVIEQIKQVAKRDIKDLESLLETKMHEYFD